MIADTFEIRGTNVKTDRRKKVYVEAYTIEQALEAAKLKGLVEPFEINRHPPKPPTEAQLSYAKDLGAQIPSDATREDLRAIISKKLEGGGDPSLGLKEFAEGRGMLLSRYMGKKELYNIVFDELEERDRIAFFVFSMYRWASEDRRANMDTHPLKSNFYSISDRLLVNERFLTSLFENYRGEDVRFFGKIIADNGFESFGGSTNTLAYREVRNLLQSELGVSIKSTNKDFTIKSKGTVKSGYDNKSVQNLEAEASMEGCGCLIFVILATLIGLGYLLA
ncbi:MAG: hypothetical protein K9G46_03640 [Flavobacteriales bacterium]|nr:hypothetical protein [Flavobacteriales bacterium]